MHLTYSLFLSVVRAKQCLDDIFAKPIATALWEKYRIHFLCSFQFEVTFKSCNQKKILLFAESCLLAHDQ
jgi:hypothetical protein